jgi:hypothetical protein
MWIPIPKSVHVRAFYVIAHRAPIKLSAHVRTPSYAPHDARGDGDMMISDRALLSACLPPGKVPKFYNGNTAV